MNRWTASRVVVVTAFVWTIAVVGYLANEVVGLLETGSGLIAVVSRLVALTVRYLSPLIIALLGLLVVRRCRGTGHAA